MNTEICVCTNTYQCRLYERCLDTNVTLIDKKYLKTCPCKLCLKNPVCDRMCKDLDKLSNEYVAEKRAAKESLLGDNYKPERRVEKISSSRR